MVGVYHVFNIPSETKGCQVGRDQNPCDIPLYWFANRDSYNWFGLLNLL